MCRDCCNPVRSHTILIVGCRKFPAFFVTLIAHLHMEGHESVLSRLAKLATVKWQLILSVSVNGCIMYEIVDLDRSWII